MSLFPFSWGGPIVGVHKLFLPQPLEFSGLMHFYIAGMSRTWGDD